MGSFKIKKIFLKEYKHLFLLLFWVCYLSSFFFLESQANIVYKPIYSVIDDFIPFCEFFIIPYVFWYFFLVFIHLYTMKNDVESFKKLMYFLIVSFGIATIVFAVYPNMQELRPTVFQRDNIFTDAVKFLYKIDTNTNVFPSLHVVGSFAVLFTAWNAKGLNKTGYRLIFSIITLLISASTVFLKQHSVMDIIAGAILSFAVYPIAFVLPDVIKRIKKERCG